MAIFCWHMAIDNFRTLPRHSTSTLLRVEDGVIYLKGKTTQTRISDESCLIQSTHLQKCLVSLFPAPVIPTFPSPKPASLIHCNDLPLFAYKFLSKRCPIQAALMTTVKIWWHQQSRCRKAGIIAGITAGAILIVGAIVAISVLFGRKTCTTVSDYNSCSWIHLHRQTHQSLPSALHSCSCY